MLHFRCDGLPKATSYSNNWGSLEGNEASFRFILGILAVATYQSTFLDLSRRLLALNNQRHLRAVDKMVPLFRDIPGAVENTVELSSRLDFQLSEFDPQPARNMLVAC